MTIINEIQLSKELIRFPSVTPKDAGAIKFLSKKLKKLGFNCKILEFKDKGSEPIKNLYARIGKKGPNLCYAGHTDVVPPGNIKDWTIDPFKPLIKKLIDPLNFRFFCKNLLTAATKHAIELFISLAPLPIK